jgi:hypothetical protein
MYSKGVRCMQTAEARIRSIWMRKDEVYEEERGEVYEEARDKADLSEKG